MSRLTSISYQFRYRFTPRNDTGNCYLEVEHEVVCKDYIMFDDGAGCTVSSPG